MKASIRGARIFFDIDGLSLVVEDGQVRQRPSAFFISGGPGVDHTGAKIRYNSLTQFMQMIYYDQRGTGYSDRGDLLTYTLVENVEDLEALRNHLGIERMISIGSSYGSCVALAHAARYPQVVSHLILIAPLVHSDYEKRSRGLVRELGTPEQIAAADDLFEGRIDSVDKMKAYFKTMGSLYSMKHDPASGVGMGSTILEFEPLNRAHAPGGCLRSFDLRPELHSITAKTLFIAGRHDWICPPEFSEEASRLIPGSRLEIFEESRHTMGADEPEKLLRIIEEFVLDCQ